MDLTTRTEIGIIALAADSSLQGSHGVRNPVAAFPEFDAEGNPPLTDGRSVIETPGIWHVARCRYRHVKAYAADLLKLSRLTDGAVNYLLPLRYGPTVSSSGTRRRKYKTPLFPGIIFVCVADDAIDLDPNHRTIPSQAIKVVNRSQDRLRADLVKVEAFALNDPDTLDVWPGIRVGQRVEVQTGVYRGYKANVIELDNGKRRLVVVLEDMQCAASVELDDSTLVEPITE